jgi:hypothetical protein
MVNVQSGRGGPPTKASLSVLPPTSPVAGYLCGRGTLAPINCPRCTITNRAEAALPQKHHYRHRRQPQLWQGTCVGGAPSPRLTLRGAPQHNSIGPRRPAHKSIIIGIAADLSCGRVLVWEGRPRPDRLSIHPTPRHPRRKNCGSLLRFFQASAAIPPTPFHDSPESAVTMGQNTHPAEDAWPRAGISVATTETCWTG